MDSFEKYIEIKEIGAGAFGQVYLVRDTQTMKFCAIKKLRLIQDLPKDDLQVSHNEVRILSKLEHPHIVTYLESYEENRHLHIVMAFYSRGDLFMKIEEKRNLRTSFEDKEIHRILYQLCSALAYIHSQRIIHRDIKPRNIFMTDEDNVKLGDFGLSKVLESSLDLAASIKGTLKYMAPEILNRQLYTNKCDMWSLGWLLYEMATLKVEFPSMPFPEMPILKCNAKYEVPLARVSSIIIKQIDKLIQIDASKRPTAKDFLAQIQMVKGNQNETICNYATQTDICTDGRMTSTLRYLKGCRNCLDYQVCAFLLFIVGTFILVGSFTRVEKLIFGVSSDTGSFSGAGSDTSSYSGAGLDKSRSSTAASDTCKISDAGSATGGSSDASSNTVKSSGAGLDTGRSSGAVLNTESSSGAGSDTGSFSGAGSDPSSLSGAGLDKSKSSNSASDTCKTSDAGSAIGGSSDAGSDTGRSSDARLDTGRFSGAVLNTESSSGAGSDTGSFSDLGSEKSELGFSYYISACICCFVIVCFRYLYYYMRILKILKDISNYISNLT